MCRSLRAAKTLTIAGALSLTLAGCSGSPLDLLLKPAVVTKPELVEAPKPRALLATCGEQPDEPAGERISRSEIYGWIDELIAWGSGCKAAVEELKGAPQPSGGK